MELINGGIFQSRRSCGNPEGATKHRQTVDVCWENFLLSTIRKMCKDFGESVGKLYPQTGSERTILNSTINIGGAV